MSKIIGVNTIFPQYKYTQAEIINLMIQIWPDKHEVLQKFLKSSGVETRHFIQPLENYPKIKGFGDRNRIYLSEIKQLQKTALEKLQKTIGFVWNDVGVIISTSITGLSVPSIEARLMNEFAIPHDTIRMPIFGLGCLGGVATLNRAHDMLKAYPKKLAIVLASEACSMTFQMDDNSMANMVATSLFADGVAAVCIAGDEHPLAKERGLRILDTQSNFYPNSQDVMGWEMVDTGFKIVLSGNVPEIVNKYVGEDVKTLLSRHKFHMNDIQHIISHPGGPKVLTAIGQAVEKTDAALKHSWESLKQNGNLSSVSVLNVLERSLAAGIAGHGLMMAMGPAFCSEFNLTIME
jgi:alkylresorcinol/alkylpyrone synthase